jgi:hypothetical protein
LSIGEYESFTFKIIDSNDTLYDKKLVLATKLDSLGEPYFESYLAKTSVDDTFADYTEGDLVSDEVLISKISTDFFFSKSIETISTSNCIYVYEETTSYPPCRKDHLRAIELGEPDPNPACDWSGTTSRTMISHSCKSGDGGGFGSNSFLVQDLVFLIMVLLVAVVRAISILKVRLHLGQRI